MGASKPDLVQPRVEPLEEKQVRPAVRRVGRENSRADFLVTLSFLGDALVILLGLWLGFWIKFRSGWLTFGVEAPDTQFWDYRNLFLVGTGFLLAAFGTLRLYDANKLLKFRQVVLVVLKATTLWLFGYLGLSLALKFEPAISRLYVVSSYVTVLGLLLLWRKLFSLLLQREFIAPTLRQRVLFVGWNQDAQRLAEVIALDPSHPYEIVGCVAPPGGSFQLEPSTGIRRLGHYGCLTNLVADQCSDIIVLADLDTPIDGIVSLSNLCEREFVQFKIIPSYFQILVSGLHLETISGVPILSISGLALDRPVNRALKRAVDIVGSLVGLALSLPVMAVCGVLVYLESPGSIFFSQERIGRSGRRFKMHKLRSMRIGADATDDVNQSTLREDQRVLRIGRLMRKWNLDETPQFWNVLRGEMSLVGPRPERTYHSEKLSGEIPHYNARYATKPGITGWAQVNGFRGDTSLVERVRFDLFYLEHWSLWLDFQIMIQTFVKRENAY